jgi:hypothetical protein
MELTTFQKLNIHINGVLGLINIVKLHEIFMVEFSHDFDFIDQRLFSFVFTESGLF